MADHAMGFAGLRAEIAARGAEGCLAEQVRQALAGIVGADEERARPAATDRAFSTESINSGEPLHVRNLGHGASECPGEITTEKVGEKR